MAISMHWLKGSISGIYPLQLDVLTTLRSCFRSHADESSSQFAPNYGILISIVTTNHIVKA